MVDVVQADLEAPGRPDSELRTLLSPDEVARADRFHFQVDRSRFIRRRAFRRMWLGEHLGIPARELRFVLGSHGKPSVSKADSRFRFNCSASGGRAVLAWSESVDLGVDLERHRPLGSDLALIAERFAPAEQQRIHEVPDADRVRLFFDCWARKEALVKAVGMGLFLPLETFSVPLDSVVVGGRVRWESSPPLGCEWWVTSLDAGEGWSAAVAADAPGEVRGSHWIWPR